MAEATLTKNIEDGEGDNITVVYKVNASFVVHAGVYNGIPDLNCLEKLVLDQIEAGAEGFVDKAEIIEVRCNDKLAAESIDSEPAN